MTQPPDADSSVFAESMIPDPQLPLFEWLLGTGASLDVPLLPNELRLLARLDAVLAADAARAELLPCAPAVIPQLMNSLRDESVSAQALEVVLKPIFDAQTGSLSGRTAPRLWLHSRAKAADCMRLAGAAGLDPFEGYLAGLMHNIGWTAALRALDKAGEVERGAPSQFSRAFVQAFEARREMFFAMLVMPWQVTDSLTALAVELLDGGLASATSKLGQALLAADRNASLDMLGAGALLDSMTVAPLSP